MKVTECFWEIQNIGKKTVEIGVEKEDKFLEADINEASSGYQYVVVKVPMDKVDFNVGLSNMGFSMIEVQMNILKKSKDFDYDSPFIKEIYNDTSFEEVVNENDFNEILSKITPDMFSTDRIVLDNHFNENIGCERYKNWMKTDFKANKSRFLKIIYKGIHVGFYMFKLENDIAHAILGGIYKGYQGYGLGVLTPSALMLYSKKGGAKIKMMKTSISSNNIPVLQFYNYFNFKITSMTYVFIKHIVSI